MKAILIEAFGKTPKLTNLSEPEIPAHGVIIEVKATGLCRSDWHALMGHDADIVLPHVPGHEFAGVVSEVGRDVKNWSVGDRVTVPFVGGCGCCDQCYSGHQQVCENQFQPGFTHWGSFAEFVAIHHADLNLVRLPDNIAFSTAASLGCRFATSFRAIVDQGRVTGGQWVAVHGCGGVGLSAITIAKAIGAQVIAVDIDDQKLQLAEKLGASCTINAISTDSVSVDIYNRSGGGVHVSVDALGHSETCFNSIMSLRTRGKHIQVGLMMGDQATPNVPMDRVIAKELEIIGSHGMQAHRYGAMMNMIEKGAIHPEMLVGREISLADIPSAIMEMDKFQTIGATVVTKF